MRIVAEIRVQAGAPEVFPWIAVPEKAMRWQPDVVEQEILVATPNLVGTTFREVVADGGRLEMRGEITRYLEGESIAFHLTSRIHELDVAYRLEALDGLTVVQAEAHVRWKFPMNLLALAIGGKMRRQLARQMSSELAELKRLCEERRRS
jgi:hypothetical protein